MASLSKAILAKRPNSLEMEREIFEKNQHSSITKAINQNEIPMKEKHARSTIIGTFTEKGAITFWNMVNRLPLQGNPIICWKFCHLLHKVLREGHYNAIKDSQRYQPMLDDLGKMWGLLRDGYGRMIACYSKLLTTKLKFHNRNPKFPGNLVVTDKELEDIGEQDVNIFFQLTCEMFDYMDDILLLQEAVFGSLDMSRANSMTPSGQCRLAPLLPCIQDSSHLYDYIVKVLFKLHAALPADTLIGHRHRFLKQFDQLKQFYLNSSNLQYFKNLFQVPLLPEHPPNLLVASDISSHISPVVVLPAHSDSPEIESLVDISESVSTNNEKFAFDTQSEASTETILDEKDHLIQQLLKDIADLKMEIQKISIEDQRTIDGLQRDIQCLEVEISELKKSKDSIHQEKEKLLNIHDEAVKNDELEKKYKVQEEKFSKLKEAYHKLREEHIDLIRNKAEIEKQINGGKLAEEEVHHVKKLMQVEKEKNEELLNDIENIRQSLSQELLDGMIHGAEHIIHSSLKHWDSSTYTYRSSSSEFLINEIQTTIEYLKSLADNIQQNIKDENNSKLLEIIPTYAHLISSLIEQGCSKASFLDQQEFEDKAHIFQSIGEASLELLEKLKMKDSELQFFFFQLMEKISAASLVPSPQSPSQEDIGTLLKSELSEMIEAIEEASKRIQEIHLKSQQDDTGSKLEVNGKILEACTTLMQAIKVLVRASRELQDEIVAQGKGSASLEDFYNRNSRWAEGLISASKVVGMGAKYLVDAADKVIVGKGKPEILVVASQEIAAGTAQLVVASRVKAAPESQSLVRLTQASKAIAHATANVVATAKSCIELNDESEMMDLTKFTLHQAKKLEMESQVRVLELEHQLTMERMKLAELRKRHYQLSGTSEGWEEKLME